MVFQLVKIAIINTKIDKNSFDYKFSKFLKFIIVIVKFNKLFCKYEF